jgi:hypothetical protein
LGLAPDCETPGLEIIMPVRISSNIRKESVRIDGNQNIIDPKTEQIIEPAEQPYKVDPADLAKAMGQGTIESPPQPQTEISSIQETKKIKIETTPKTLKEIKTAIKRVEAELAELQELKKKKVEEMKKELEEAE